jgi:serine/threonine protein kinase
MKLLQDGSTLDGFRIESCLHSGGMAHIYRVSYADGRADPGFPMAMKVPRMASGDGAENIVGFEVECNILQALSGPHVPRFVAAGDLQRVPYLVMEYVQGRTLQYWVEQHAALDTATIARLGVGMAQAVHALHRQDAVHLDLKPDNLLLRSGPSAPNEATDLAVPASPMLLLDFGLSFHAHYPDLLAEQLRKAVGSPAWIAPEQVVGVRGDLRSDIFAIGVMLYQLCTGHLPFGTPRTPAGLRQRLWVDPVPPRKYRPELPPWLQEVVMRCLEPEAARRYPSAAHLAFDLAHPTQIAVSARGSNTQSTSVWTHTKRWLKAAGMHYQPSPLVSEQISQVPIVMVALPYENASDATLYSLREAAARSLGIRPGARLACVTVIPERLSNSSIDAQSETSVQRRYLAWLHEWARALNHPGHQTSCHVLESGNVAQALVNYALGNHVHMIVMGAATHGLKTQRLMATVPIKVAMAAPCTVILVKQALPFEHLGGLDEGLKKAFPITN